MERTKTGEPGKILWICKGSSFRMGKGKIIKRNQRFSATIDEIPKAFRDTIIPVNPEELKSVEAIPDAKVLEMDYTVKHVNSGWYNVLDSNGKVMNEAKLRKEQAEELLESLKG